MRKVKLGFVIFLMFWFSAFLIKAADFMRDFYFGEPIEEIATSRNIEYTHYWPEADCDVYITYISDGEDSKFEFGTAEADIACYRLYVQNGALVGLSAHLRDLNWNWLFTSDFEREFTAMYGRPIYTEENTIVMWLVDDKFVYMMCLPVGNNQTLVSVSAVTSEVAFSVFGV